MVLTLPSGGTEDAWQAFLARSALCLSDEWRRQNHFEGKYATLLDLSAVTDNNAKRRREWDALMEANAAVIKRDSVGTALVLTSAVGRFIVTALQWLEAARGGERQLIEVFKTAETLCVARLAEVERHVPPGPG